MVSNIVKNWWSEIMERKSTILVIENLGLENERAVFYAPLLEGSGKNISEFKNEFDGLVEKYGLKRAKSVK